MISEINHKEGDTVKVGAVLGSVTPVKEEIVQIEKVKPTAAKIKKTASGSLKSHISKYLDIEGGCQQS